MSSASKALTVLRQVKASARGYRPPAKPFAVLATTLCRTSINSLPYFSKLFAVLASVCGKGFVRTRQRAQCPTAKNRTVSPKGTSGLGQSAAQASPKSPSDRCKVPVGLSRQTSRAFRRVIALRRSRHRHIDGYGSGERWLSLPRTDNHPYERPMVIPHEDSRLWDRRPTVIPSADP